MIKTHTHTHTHTHTQKHQKTNKNKQHKPVVLLGRKEGRKEEVFYLTTHSTHFIYGYMVSDIL